MPGGTFNRSNDSNYPATVDNFYLDKYEITVGRFRKFVNQGRGTQAIPPTPGAGLHPLITGSGWNSDWNANLPLTTSDLKTDLKCYSDYQTWTDSAGSNESLPQNCLSWYEAFAFCAWDGGRLATEAEWNYVAAGGDEQRYFPWVGTKSDSTKASFGCMADGNPACTLSDIIAVGSRPTGNGKWGHADMGGNVWEWTLDSYVSPYQTPCHNCADLDATYGRVMRGGSFYDDSIYMWSAYRDDVNPTAYIFYLGGRCARSSP